MLSANSVIIPKDKGYNARAQLAKMLEEDQPLTASEVMVILSSALSMAWAKASQRTIKNKEKAEFLRIVVSGSKAYAELLQVVDFEDRLTALEGKVGVNTVEE